MSILPYSGLPTAEGYFSSSLTLLITVVPQRHSNIAVGPSSTCCFLQCLNAYRITVFRYLYHNSDPVLS